MKVKVKDGMTGYFEHERKRAGDVFNVPDEPRREPTAFEMRDPDYKLALGEDGKLPQTYSVKWMEPAGEREEIVTTSAPDALKKKHNEIKKEKAGSQVSDNTGTGDRI